GGTMVRPLPVILAAVVLSIPALSSAVYSDPSLVASGFYNPPSGLALDYGVGGGVFYTLSNITLHLQTLTRTDLDPDEQEDGNAFLMADVTINGSIPLGPTPFFGTFSVLTHNKIGNTTGTFNAELLSLNVTGGPGLIFRESPTLQS